jgi:protease-4
MQDLDILSKLYHKSLLKKISRWRLFAIIFIILFIVKIIPSNKNGIPSSSDYIAEISIEGFISDNKTRNSKLEKIANNDKIKAVILNINSPGGTFVGGENLYHNIKKISAKKPVVALIGEQGTSAAYLASLGANQIFAFNGSLVGSVGVLLQSFEVTELAKKIGVKPIILKSSKFKASPHPAESMDNENKQYLQDVITDSQIIFVEFVKQSRKSMSEETLKEVSLGKVYVGSKAQKMNLIDKIGQKDNALQWLKTQKISVNKVISIELIPQNKTLKGFLNNFDPKNLINNYLGILSYHK